MKEKLKDLHLDVISVIYHIILALVYLGVVNIGLDIHTLNLLLFISLIFFILVIIWSIILKKYIRLLYSSIINGIIIAYIFLTFSIL